MNKDLKYLSKNELLELLLEQVNINENLEKENNDLRAKLDEKEILIEESGSIAEASLRLNKVFEAAQEAADQYLYNIKKQK